MKKIIVALILFASIFVIKVNAEEVYYTNQNEVSFTKEEYDFFSEFFYEGYQDIVTKEEYNSYEKEEMKAELVETNYAIVPYDASHTTDNKTIKISNSGNNKISIVATWKNDPKVRSYDVIGAYLEGPKWNNMLTRINYNSGNYSSNEINSFYNGFGVSVKLPSNGSNIIVSQSFNYTGSGTIYGNYQHAKSSVTLAQSKKYTIDRNGFGGVFSFYDGIGSKYDAMGGVSINV